MKKDTNTGLRGISKHKSSGKYEVRVAVRDGSITHNFYVGLSPTLPAAVRARQDFITNLL